VSTFQRSISLVAQLPCDVLISVHPEFSDMDRKLALRAGGRSANPFVDNQGCRTYAASARQALDRRVLDEK
jgi:metallo-beta-lactamase class B